MTKKVKLITKSYNVDSIGQKVPSETTKEIFCDVSSISSKEFASAGAIGLKPSLMIRVWLNEYHGEDNLEYDGERYSIYRTYKPGNGRIELYVEKDVGA